MPLQKATLSKTCPENQKPASQQSNRRTKNQEQFNKNITKIQTLG